jgi:hypothetical protein
MNTPFVNVATELGTVFCVDLVVEPTENFGPKCQFYCLDVEFYFRGNSGEEYDTRLGLPELDYCVDLVKLNRGGYSEEYNNMYTSIAKHYTKKIAVVLCVECFLIEDCQDIVMQVNGQKAS